VSHANADICHVDMDAFFVSVELNRRPELRGQPVVVGGTGSRGVVAAASYEARSYGVFSAMASARARQLCPDAVFLPGDHARYSEVSARVFEIFRDFTPLVEPLSLDEAFLDLSGAGRLHGRPQEIAANIRSRVLDEQQLACSVGIAVNKFLAKLATERAKPIASRSGPIPGVGVVTVEPGRELAFLHPLEVGDLWGVGPSTRARLEQLGVRTVGELAAIPLDSLVAAVGRSHGRHLHDLAHGRDERPVEPHQEPKSISHEETFPSDIYDPRKLESEIVNLADSVGSRLRRAGVVGRTVNLKIRFGDFRTLSRSEGVDPTDSGAAIARVAKRLLARVELDDGVRLIGVGVSSLGADQGRQLTLDDLQGGDWEHAEAAVDAIRSKFGSAAIGRAATGGAATSQPGGAMWGPDEES
jgi:DNA polymerase-4